MLARFEHTFQIHETAVALDEVAIDLRRYLASLKEACPVNRTNLTRCWQPTQSVRVDLIARHVATPNLLDDAVPLKREKQKSDRLIDFSSTKVLSLRHVRRQRAPYITA